MDPIASTETRRRAALGKLDPSTQAVLGQFFTPMKAASLMASMLRVDGLSGTVRVLDPGAGVGSLSAALVDRLHTERPDIAVHVVAVETDPLITPHLRATLEECQAAYGISYDLIEGDYLLDEGAELDGPFDLVIANPPYGKLASDSPARLATAGRAVDTPNVYVAFWARAVASLKKDGQGVFIVPRSWASGPYYRPFRRWLLSTTSLDVLHEFESRTRVFAEGKVKQENVIISCTLRPQSSNVILSKSVAHDEKPAARTVPFSTIVQAEDADKIVHFVDGTSVPSAARFTLADLGISVSTGKVVDFRNRQYLTDNLDTPGVAPMVYQSNIRSGRIDWPQAKARKPQGFIAVEDAAIRQLLPQGTYVVVKRQTAKEDRRRVIAALWDGPNKVAFDNKTNYLHESNSPLDRDLARGLMLWLNSTILDRYFRAFSGHTQVNAGDLRRLPFPSREDLILLAKTAPDGLPDQKELDAVVAKLFSEVPDSTA
ncbi:Eco57I restriction-modification methylase domain-containing protein [Streptomyces sp. F-1]|uniref:Eco57I restriction-modification methylase domain-containing protein n=1 Tax=Streptomyces sp. F-1 TaxID=463642 RepID=UPI00085C0DE6|nr:Eco57I restriction-modification methylase domain-containing protein [Streptomyces sp. F-1]